MVATTRTPSKASSRSSAISMMVVGAVWLALLWGSTAEAAIDAEMAYGLAIEAANNRPDFERLLPSYYYSKKSKSSKYEYYGSKSGKYDYYGSKSGKYSKKYKDCKSVKSNKYGYYDHCFETEPPIFDDDGNSTDIDDLDDILMDSEDEIHSDSFDYYYYHWKGGKGSKSSKVYTYYQKSYKSYKSKSYKYEKSYKSKSSKKKDKYSKSVTKAPAEAPDIIPSPEVTWTQTFEDAIDTGVLFYDPVTKYAWYIYSAEVEGGLISKESEDGEDKDETPATIGRICPLDTADEGKILESLCIEIEAPEDWKMVTSTKIVTAAPCFGEITGAIFKLAVVVQDSSKVLHLEEELVGSRMLVYDIVVGGKTGGSDPEPIIAEVAYEGWKSLYASSIINGKPAFSPDCKKVFATWMTKNGEGGENSALHSSVTIATDVEAVAKDGESSELWRLGTSSRLAGLVSSKDGKSVFSATNVPEGDSFNSGGIVQLDSKTGEIEQEYAYTTNDEGFPNNAYTNLVLDDTGNSYHVDSLLGIIKFDSDDLNDGPVWSAVDGTGEEESESKDETKEETMTRKLEPARPRDASSKMLTSDSEDVVTAFTAFKPALDTDFSTIYACGNYVEDGLLAMKADFGMLWFAEFDDYEVDVPSCGGITADVVFAPSSFTSSGNAVYVARGSLIMALDTEDGSVLWTYEMGDDDHDGTTAFVVVDEDTVLAANTGTVVGLDTNYEGPPTPSPPPTTAAPNPPTDTPTRRPLQTPAPFNPTAPTPEPTSSSASMRGLSCAAAIVSATLLLMLR